MTSAEATTRQSAVLPGRPKMAKVGWLFGIPWLFYLAPAFQVAWEQENTALRVFGVAVLAAFAVWYVAIFALVRTHRFGLWDDVKVRGPAAIGLLALLGVLAIPASGSQALSTVVYLSAASMMVLPFRISFGIAGGLLALSVLLDVFVPGYNTGVGLIFGIVVSAVGIWGIRQMISRNVELMAAQQTVAQLAIAEERARTARDLHDILGHSLTVITVKAELAGRLIRLDPDRAEKEVADLERLSREALADVRRTVNGFRAVTLAGEIVSARTALDAAAIDAVLPIALDDVPGERRELFGWVVREGVTNVIRHAAATRCVVTVTANSVEVADDGRGPAAAAAAAAGSGVASGLSGASARDGAAGPGGVSGLDGAASPGGVSGLDGAHGGHGLTGLRERVESAGGSLAVGRSDLGGFLLRVTLGRSR